MYSQYILSTINLIFFRRAVQLVRVNYNEYKKLYHAKLVVFAYIPIKLKI